MNDYNDIIAKLNYVINDLEFSTELETKFLGVTKSHMIVYKDNDLKFLKEVKAEIKKILKLQDGGVWHTNGREYQRKGVSN